MSESFDVFLSHNSQDKPKVRKLVEALKLYGLRVWLDEEQLVLGHLWQEGLETIIQTTQAAVVLIGESGLGPWEEPEMRALLSEFVKRKMPVIPVLLPGTPAAPKLPLFLQSFTWVDLRDGLTDLGVEKLVWGITGVKPGTTTIPPILPNPKKLSPIFFLFLLLGIFVSLFILKSYNKDKAPNTSKEVNNNISQNGNTKNPCENGFVLVKTDPNSQIKDFCIGENEVTAEDYAAYARENNINGNEKIELTNMPITKINYVQALEYCSKLGKKLGKKIRLPTNLEWVYACRKGGDIFPWGDSEQNAESFARFNQAEYGPLPVDTMKKTGIGLYNMAGNVWEWVQDPSKPDEIAKPIGGRHWIMGGSFNNDINDMKCDSKKEAYGIGDKDIGFRMVQEIGS